MYEDQSFAAIELNHQQIQPTVEVIKSNLKQLKIRPNDIDSIVKDAQNACKMVFEQVFLVMRYVRYMLEDKRMAQYVIGRMNFLLAVFDNYENVDQEDLDNIRSSVLKKLEENLGSNDIIAYLQSLNSDISDSILRKMQENGVAFAPIHRVHMIGLSRPYPYYDLYMCLHHPIEIFRMMLSQRIYQAADIERIVYDEIKLLATKIKHEADRKTYVISNDKITEDEQKKIFELDKLSKDGEFAQIVDGYYQNAKDYVLSEVRSNLAVELGNWASDIFAKISNPSYASVLKETPWKKQVTFNDFFKIYNESDRTIISIQSALVGNLHKLNQLDDLFDSLKLAVKAKLDSHRVTGRPYQAEVHFNNENALAEISAWYDRYSTRMFKKIDQIPKAIVSIIHFDLERNSPSLKKVIYDAQSLKDAYDKLETDSSAKRASPVKERNMLITCIISLNLYLDSDSRKENLRGITESIRNENNSSIKGLYSLGNPIMSLWTVFKEQENNLDAGLNANFGEDEQKQMMHRFKTVPVFFKREARIELNELIGDINGQSSTEEPVPFPYNSTFPLPLWIRKTPKIDNNDGEIETGSKSESSEE